MTPTLDSVLITPSSFTLEPNASITVTVEYDTIELELFPAGTLEGAINMTVSAEAIVIPEIPALPPQPPLPEVPRQIISRVEIIPTNYTLSEVNETKQFTAQLLVDDVIVPATFTWSLKNDLADAFNISETSGVVRALKNRINTATVEARVVTPTIYSRTVGLSVVATNIPIIVEQNSETPQITTGNLLVTILNMPASIGANVTIPGLNEGQPITSTRVFNDIAVGTYTVTPSVVTAGGENYNPSGGGQIYVGPGENREIIITYEREIPTIVNAAQPNVFNINIIDILNNIGNPITSDTIYNVGDIFTVRAQTTVNNVVASLGTIRFTATNTREGTADVTSTQGNAQATFTVAEPGRITVSAINETAGSATRFFEAIQPITEDDSGGIFNIFTTPVTPITIDGGSTTINTTRTIGSGGGSSPTTTEINGGGSIDTIGNIGFINEE